MDIDDPQNRLHQSGAVPQDTNAPWIPDGFIIGLVITLAVMMVAGVAFGVNRFQSRDTDTASVESTDDGNDDLGDSDTSTSQPNDFEPIACPDGTEETICEAATFVQAIRQKPFKTFPEVELLESSAFNEALLEDYDEGREDLEHAELAFKGLGMIDSDMNLFEEFRNMLSVNVVGFYDPEIGRLVVRGEDLNLYVRSVLVHELVHALDDQWFDLDREFEDDEESYGFAAIAEGNATRVDEAWEAQLGNDEREQLERDRASSFRLEDLQQLESLPRAVIELQTSPYIDGPRFLDSATSEESDIDGFLTDPPTTSERILHPEVSAEDDPQVAVELPERVDVIDDGKLGEVVVRQLFGPEAAAGWEGDSYVVWSDEGRACIAADVVVETEQDLVELAIAVESWATEVEGRSSNRFSEAGVFGLSFTNCVG